MFTGQRRYEVERDIIRATIIEAIGQGWTLHSVSHGGGTLTTQNSRLAVDAACECDEAHVFFTRPGDEKRAWFFVVLGNSGWDVIADYTLSLDSVITANDDLVARYEAEAEEVAS